MRELGSDGSVFSTLARIAHYSPAQALVGEKWGPPPGEPPAAPPAPRYAGVLWELRVDERRSPPICARVSGLLDWAGGEVELISASIQWSRAGKEPGSYRALPPPVRYLDRRAAIAALWSEGWSDARIAALFRAQSRPSYSGHKKTLRPWVAGEIWPAYRTPLKRWECEARARAEEVWGPIDDSAP